MTRRITLLALTLLLGTAACSSDASKGGVAAGSTTTLAAGDTTTSAATDAATTTAAGDPTTTADPGAPTTLAPTPTAAPATPAPTAAPTTVACRNVASLYGLTDVSGVNVRRGDCGEGVRDIQNQLNYRIAAGLTVDGRFGPGTEAAVREFQTSVGLPADGIVGPNTWVALTSDDYDASDA